MELIEARNRADSLIFQIEKQLKEAGDKIGDRDKAPIQTAIERLRQEMSRDDAAAINRAQNDLMQAAQAMAAHVQRGPSPDGSSPEGGAAGKGKDDVIDAEFEVKK